MSHASIKLSSPSICLISLLTLICQLQTTLTSTTSTMESAPRIVRQFEGLNKSSQAAATAIRPAADEQQEVELSPASGWTDHSPALKQQRRQQGGRVYRIRAAGANGSFSSAGLLELRRAEREREPNASSIERADTRQPAQQFGARQRTARLLAERKSASSQEAKSRGCEQPAGELAQGESTAAEASSISASSQTLRFNSRPAGSSSSVVVLRPLAGQQEAPESDGGATLTPDLSTATRGQATSEADGHTNDPLTQSRESSILSLIDEFDSKITTNRTQGESGRKLYRFPRTRSSSGQATLASLRQAVTSSEFDDIYFSCVESSTRQQLELACDSGEMVVRLNFTQPFKGIVYPEHNRLSPCRFFGDGHHNYELRLPLRGCGTKQVAPRLFVNDVIVRFHKTLELEEDEVKTLICRYPAPLDAGQQAAGGGQRERERLAAGNGLVHELAHATSNSSQLEQFELLEPQGGATKTNRFGQQELFGELLAPPSANPSRHLNGQLPSQTLQELQERQRNRQQQYADLILAPPLGATKSQPGHQATNSRLFEGVEPLGGDTLQTASSNSSGGFLDRLTSIELLFLISSLVFLALLAFGLLLSYWCFWRRRRDPLAGAPTSGTRRRLRYFNPPHLAAAGAGSRPLYTPTQHYSIEATPTSLYHQARQQQQHPAALFYQQQQQYLSQPQMGASSPDDSDVSGRVLLPPPAGSDHQSLMLSQRAPVRRARQENSHEDADQSASRHYKASTIARHQPAPAIGRRGRPKDVAPMSQTLGRRAEQQRRSGGYLAANLRTGEPEEAQHVVKSGTLNVHSSSREPLLKMASGRNEHLSKRAQQSHLRSASSVQHLGEQQPGELVGWQKHQQQLARFRDEHEFLQRAPVKACEYQEQEAFVDYKHRRAHARQLAPNLTRLVDVNSSSSSPSSSELASEAELGLNSSQKREPKLILKSIEDSFVTNFTEIHEQEYRKYDNQRPLSMAEWRARQPTTSGAAASGASLRRQRGAKQTEAGASLSDSERHLETAPRDLPSTAGLRSLTELDVNFAKSLPRPQRGALTQRQQTSEPTAGAERQPEQREAPSEVPSPDLIISPDYNFGRFKLVHDEPAGAPRAGRTRNEGAKTPGAESHESISYV